MCDTDLVLQIYCPCADGVNSERCSRSAVKQYGLKECVVLIQHVNDITKRHRTSFSSDQEGGSGLCRNEHYLGSVCAVSTIPNPNP